MKGRQTLKIKNEIYHERDNRSLRRCILGVVAGILIACGFGFAAQQHFTAVEQSIRNVEMQRERERLKNEQKRLIFEREIAASPAQLEIRARKIGLQNVSALQINSLGVTAVNPEENRLQKQEQTAGVKSSFIKSREMKTN